MKEFKCEACGYVAQGESAPEKCPVCGAPQDCFVDIDNGEENEE